MANGTFLIKIATKPYLKKYLYHLYGEPLVFSTCNYFGMSVAAFLQRPYEFHKPAEELRRRTDKFNDQLEIFLPERMRAKRFSHDLTDKHIISLNKLFETRFCEDLCKWCELGTIYNVQYKKNLEDFCWRNKIEIPEDITYDAIKKKEYRFRISGTVFS